MKYRLQHNTPVEDYTKDYGLWVKREDLSCGFPGPSFSKIRGVFAHLRDIDNPVIGVLDTYHSQAGHAVAYVCKALGKSCVNFYPEYKYDKVLRKPQIRSRALGAKLYPLVAGRSVILYNQAKKLVQTEFNGYMIANALKLDESVIETAKEVPYKPFDNVVIPVSSGTIAAGVILGFESLNYHPKYILHLGYSRSHQEVERYVKEKSGFMDVRIEIVDEAYVYKDKAKSGETPPWPCNEYYDLKAFRWWLGNKQKGSTLFWNVG